METKIQRHIEFARGNVDAVADRTVDYAIDAALAAIREHLGLHSEARCGSRETVAAAEEAMANVVRLFIERYR